MVRDPGSPRLHVFFGMAGSGSSLEGRSKLFSVVGPWVR